MALMAECDGCGVKEPLGDIAHWRTLTVRFEHPPCSVDHGTGDSICELALCRECKDLADWERIELAVKTAVARESREVSDK